MFSNRLEFVQLDGNGQQAVAVFTNRMGIGLLTPFSKEVRFTRLECESLLKSLESDKSMNAYMSTRAVLDAMSYFRVNN